MTNPMGSAIGFAILDPAIPAGLLTDNIAGEMEDALRLHAGELADLEFYNISARTPVRTGALLSDLQEQANVSNSILAYIFFGTSNQLDEWDRVYVQYQEGPPLGASTYTNPARQMVTLSVTEDIPAIEAWGNGVLEDWVGEVLGG
jgi:hypothetical protein